MTDNKLVQRYNEIETELEAIVSIAGQTTDISALQERITDLEAKQAELKKTLQHLIALTSIKDEAWRALSYGVSS